jgi:GT2 family glycosyltransferase
MGYREEVDLCFRAREAGYKIVSAPNAKYIHFTSQTNSKLGIVNSTHDYFMSKWSRKLQLGLV